MLSVGPTTKVFEQGTMFAVPPKKPDATRGPRKSGLSWTVRQEPLYRRDRSTLDGWAANVRSDTSEILGVVTNRYTVIQNREAFAFLANLLGGELAFETAGSLHGDDIWAELARMCVCVHASVVPEPFGQVIVEAMAAGIPVGATADGGPGEILTDGVDGLTYRSGDVAALTAALRRLRADRTVRDELITNGRRRAADFSPRESAAALTPIYRAVCCPS